MEKNNQNKIILGMIGATSFIVLGLMALIIIVRVRQSSTVEERSLPGYKGGKIPFKNGLRKDSRVFIAPIANAQGKILDAVDAAKAKLLKEPKLNIVDDISKAEVVILPVNCNSRFGGDVRDAYTNFDGTLGDKSPSKIILFNLAHTLDPTFASGRSSEYLPPELDSGRKYDLINVVFLTWHETKPRPYLLKSPKNDEEIRWLKEQFGFE